MSPKARDRSDRPQSDRGEGGTDDDRRQDRGRSIAEWVSVGISLAIVLALAGLVVYQYLVGGTRPPLVVVTPQLDAIRREADAYYLPVEVVNRGDKTAEDVRVLLSLSSDQGARQSAELGVDFLAGGETARWTVVFREDPSRGRLTVDMLSFLEP
jgi:uncharacterized protein (TIGR02588 family)